MKKILLIVLLFTGIIFAQTDTSVTNVNNTVEKIFSLSKKGDYKAACNYIAYSGNDANRKYTAKLNSNSADELKTAERKLKKIKAYLDISDSYEIIGNTPTNKEETDFTIVEVAFKSGKQILKIQFEFVKLNNALLLAAIE